MKIKRFEFNMFPENCYVLWGKACSTSGCQY